jgi:hypothetical protein
MIHQTVAIPEQDYALFLEVIKRFKWKVEDKTPVAKTKDNLLLDEIKEAVDSMNLVKQGKLKARPIQDLLDEL